MRLLLALAALLVPTAAGHGESDVGEPLAPGSYLNHVQLWSPDLSAGEERASLAFAGGPMHEDWLLALHGVVENGSVQIGIGDDGSPAWTWVPGDHTETMRIEHAGFPEMWARPLEGNATLRLYYDVTCDCTGKAAPMNEGPLWFNTEARAGDAVSLFFQMQPGPAGFGRPDPYNGTLDVRIRLVEADRTGRALETMQESTVSYDAAATPTCLADGTWGVCQWFNFTAARDGRQLVLMEFAHERPDWGVSVRPTLGVRPAADQETPGPGVLPLLALLAIVARRG